MKRLLLGGLVFLAVVAAAVSLRVVRLADRPMHGDEAIQARKSGDLWENGHLKYDPRGYHGPTLQYLTLPFLWLSGARNFSETCERDYRIVPALFGAALVLLIWAMSDGLGFGAATMAAVLAAISPAMVFYSRYYIQETLLVFFTLATIVSGWRYVRSGSRTWLYYAGVYAGLMLATKETALIGLGCMAVAFLMVTRFCASSGGVLATAKRLAGPAAVAVVTAFLCLSVLLMQPGAAGDALRAPLHYAGLGFGGSVHDHPFTYYLEILLFSRPEAGGAWWSEALILVLAAFGGLAVFVGVHRPEAGLPLTRFLALYSLFTVVVYSLIPYKTPWCMLSFLSGFIILSGVGAAGLLRSVGNPAGRSVVAALIAVAGMHLAWQAYRASFVYPSDRRNPYVYAHPTRDVQRLGTRVEQIARLHPAGWDMPVQVIAPDPWPLPWYFRRLNRVGYWTDAPGDISAPVVIADAEARWKVPVRMRRTHEVMYYGLRPPVLLAACFEKGLWEEYLKAREEEAREPDDR